MRKINIIISLLLVLLIASCDKTKSFEYKTYEMTPPSEIKETSYLIYSYDIYLNLIEEYNLPNEYDVQYFDSELLICVIIPNTNKENFGKVENYHIYQNKLIIKMDSNNNLNNEENTTALMLFEYQNTILNMINSIRLETNNIYDIEINLNSEFDYARSFLCNSRYNGKTFIIDSYEKYCEFYNEEQLNYKNIEMLNEDIFSKKSLIVVRYNQSLSTTSFDINTYFENKLLVINIHSITTEYVNFNCGYVALIQIDKVLLDHTTDVRVIKDNQEITNNSEIQNYECYLQDEIFLKQHYGTYKIIDTKEQLIKSCDDQNIINNYSDDFFLEKSLVIFKMVVGYNFKFCDLWYYIENDSLIINYQVLLEGQISTYDYLGVVEIDKNILLDFSNIEIYAHKDNENKVKISKNDDEIVSYGNYNYSEYLCEFVDKKIYIIDSYKDISISAQPLYPKDIFEEKVILLYTFNLNENSRFYNVSYEIVNNILYISYLYQEYNYNVSQTTERYIAIEMPIEIYNDVRQIYINNLEIK